MFGLFFLGKVETQKQDIVISKTLLTFVHEINVEKFGLLATTEKNAKS